MKQSKAAVHYRPARQGAYRRCGSCKYFEVKADETCTKVQGRILFEDDCDVYKEASDG